MKKIKLLTALSILFMFLALIVWSSMIFLSDSPAAIHDNLDNTIKQIEDLGIVFYLIYIVGMLSALFLFLLGRQLIIFYLKEKTIRYRIGIISILVFFISKFSMSLLQITVVPYYMSIYPTDAGSVQMLKLLMSFWPESIPFWLFELGSVAIAVAFLFVGLELKKKTALEKLAGNLLVLHFAVLVLGIAVSPISIDLKDFIYPLEDGTKILGLLIYFLSFDKPDLRLNRDRPIINQEQI